MQKYVIHCVGSDDDFWSNADGWGDYDSATRFTDQEALWYHLPMGGEWISENTAKRLYVPA